MTAAQIIADKQKNYKIKFANAAKANEIIIEIFGEIGEWWGYSLRELAYDLFGKSDPVRVLLNSCGGDLTQGIALRSFLNNYPGEVTVEILGMAASSATILATGADTVEINDGALYMIHCPEMPEGGNAQEMQQGIDTLKKLEDSMAQMYLAGIKKRDKMNGMSDEEMINQIKTWMNNETWFTSQEAVDYGFADAVIGTADLNTVDTAIGAQLTKQIFAQYKNAPKRVLNLATNMANTTEKKPGNVFAKIKEFFNSLELENETATEQTTETETTTEVDPIKAAKELLVAQGYTVAEATTEEPTTTETAIETAPITNTAKTYTEAELKALVTAMMNEEVGKKKAGTSVTAAAGSTTATGADRLTAIKAKAAKALAPMANALKNQH